MPKILIAECKQEVSSFNPVASTYQDFEIGFGEDICQYHQNVKTEIGGALTVFGQAPDIDIVAKL